MISHPTRATLLAAVALNLVALSGFAQPPEPVQEMSGSTDPEVTPLAAVFAGNDGGAYYVRERGDQVYWFAEHPGRDYAHVFRGTRRGDSIVGTYWSVPKGGAGSSGRVELRIRSSGTMRVTRADDDFPTRRFSVKTIDEIEHLLPGPTWPRFNAPGADYDGGYVDEQGRRYYLRTSDGNVVFFVESHFERGDRPRAAYVFVGRPVHEGSRLVSGEMVAVPKGRRTKSGTFSFAVSSDKAINGRSDFPFFRDVYLRPLVATRRLELLGRGRPFDAFTTFNKGFELYEGDIVVSGSSGFRSLVITDKGRFWPNCEVPYDVDGRSPITQQERNWIQQAVDSFNSRTNIRWRRRTSDDRDYVVFRAIDGLCRGEDGLEITCGNSELGRVHPGKPQFINFSSGNTVGVGLLRHEMGHAIGLRHEQSRVDRDEFVEIVRSAILPGTGDNFKKESGEALDIGPYDYASMMHYGPRAFSRDGRMTIVPKVEGVTIGLRDFSQGDLEAMEHLCPSVLQVPGVSRRDHGAGIAVAHLGGHAQMPEIVLLAYDDAAGDNLVKYRLGRDASATGVAIWSDTVHQAPGGMGHRGDGAGVALADLDGNSVPEMVVVVYDGGDPENVLKARVGRDIQADGSSGQAWGPRRVLADGLSLGDAGQGLGVDFGDIDRDGRPDLVVAVYDAPEGPNKIKYMIGFGFQIDGSARWEGPYSAGSLGHRGDGLGLAVGDVDSNGVPDIVFGVLDDSPGEDVFKIKFLLNVTRNGTTSQTRTERLHGHSHSSDGAGIAIFDFDRDGEDDLVLMSADDPGNDPGRDNQWKYRVVRGGASQ